jgi:hypothetical protein
VDDSPAVLYRSAIHDLLSEQEATLERLIFMEEKCSGLQGRLNEARDHILSLEQECALLRAALQDARAPRETLTPCEAGSLGAA